MRFILAALLALLLTPTASAQTVRWYLVELFGSPAGTMKAMEREEGGNIISSTDMSFEIKRGQVAIKISMSSEFVETKDGKPVSMKSIQNMGLRPVNQEYTFGENEIKLVSRQGDQVTQSTLKPPQGEWLTPAAADRYMVQRFKSGAKEMTVRTLDASSGLTPASTTRLVGEKTTIKALDRDMAVTKCTSTVSSAPGIKSTEYVDDQGVMVRTQTQLGGMEMVMTICTEAQAIKGTGGAVIPDAFTGTFIRPEGVITGPRELTHAVYRLSVDDGELAALPDTGTQKFSRESPREALVTVSTGPFAPAPAEDVKNPAFLASTSMCNLEDDAVKKVAKRAVKDLAADASVLEKAQACRSYVYTFIRKKSLGVGFATATEICRTKEGDCSEHGVLLCAMLRSNGIPARVASGLIYADSFAGADKIFGYHMWAQALIEIDGVHRWVDLDATLPSVAYDATHLCLGVSELAEGELSSSMSSVAANMGRLKIKVIETTPAAKVAP